MGDGAAREALMPSCGRRGGGQVEDMMTTSARILALPGRERGHSKGKQRKRGGYSLEHGDSERSK